MSGGHIPHFGEQREKPVPRALKVLTKNHTPIRAYFDAKRAESDYALANGVRSDSDYFELHDVPIIE